MVDRAVIARKLASAHAHLARAVAKRPRQRDLFVADEDARDLVTHHLWLAIQDSLDIALHFVADRGWGPAQTYGDAFDLLLQHKVISAKQAGRLRKTAGLRNLIVHRYADLSLSVMFDEFPGHRRALQEFLCAMARYLR